MRRFTVMVLVLGLILASGFIAAGNKDKEPKEPTIVVTNGFYSGSLVNDGNGRSVLIVNTQTGDFEVFDVDRQGMERKTNDMYYSSIKYNHAEGTRQLIKYKVAADVKAGAAQE
jgi:hypothetical protein